MEVALNQILVFRARANLCAVPLSCVLETMRPLPMERLPEIPAFVCGLSVIRGIPCPVVDVGALLDRKEPKSITRFISLRLSDSKRIALAVDAVLGVRELDPSVLQRMPSLLQSADSESIEAIGTLDGELLMVLEASKMLAEETWQSLGKGEQTA